MSINTITKQIKAMSYEDKSQVFNACFNLGYFGKNINTKGPLLGLLALVSNRLQKANPSVTNTYEVLKQIIKPKGSDEDLMSLGLFVDSFSYGVEDFDTYGLKDSQAIMAKIRELLSKWTPF